MLTGFFNTNNNTGSLIYGYGDNDILWGGDGENTFYYTAITDGNDTIRYFTVKCVINLADLLSYNSNDGDIISDFISTTAVTDNGDDYILINIDANGDGSGTDVSISLFDMDSKLFLVVLSTLINNGSLVLEQ